MLSEDSDNRSTASQESQEDEKADFSDDTPHPFSQNELNDLVRDLNLSKSSAELLASRLKEKSFLSHGTRITFYRNRHQEFLHFFFEEKIWFTAQILFIFCKSLECHIMNPKISYLVIDSCKRSFKCVLLHNGNQLASVPLGHSTSPKENYDSVKYVLEKISHCQHEWQICADLKMVNLLLGQQSGFTKYPCFLCMWDRSQLYIKKDWPARDEMVPGRSNNIVNNPLVDRHKILLPPLHIKLGLIKQFTKALEKDSSCFSYLCHVFPGLSIEKLKGGIFDGPQVRQLIRDPEFEKSITKLELEAWKAFVLVVKNLLGNNKASNYEELITNMLYAFKSLGCNMSIKMHYLFSHIDRFPENLGALSDAQGERFHQHLKK